MKKILIAVFLSGAVLGGVLVKASTPVPQRPCLLYHVQHKPYAERPKNLYLNCDGGSSAVTLQLAENVYVWMEVGE